VLRPQDGRTLGQLALPPELVRSAATTPHAITWLFGSPSALSVGHAALAIQPAERPRPVAASPPWLRPGVVLHYVEVRFDHRDAQTGGLMGALPPREVDVTILQLDPQVILQISGTHLKPRRVRVPREHPTELSSLFRGDAKPAKDSSPIHLDLAALEATKQGAQLSLQPGDPGVTYAGSRLHRVGYVAQGKQAPTPRDLRAIRLRSIAPLGPNAHHYLVAPWAQLPIVLRVDGPKHLLLLTAVIANTP